MRTRESEIELHELVQNLERKADVETKKGYFGGWWSDGKSEITYEEKTCAYHRGMAEGLSYAINRLNQFIGVENGRS